MTKICIISSYDDLCGVASYTKSLISEFNNESITVEVINLNQSLLHSSKKIDKELAKKYILEICRDIKNFNYINIQFEFGLFGNNIFDIYMRIFTILKCCTGKHISITYHTIITDSYTDILSCFIKNLLFLKIRAAFNSLCLINNVLKKVLLARITKFVIKNNGYIIVHTERDKKNIVNLYGQMTDKIISHPLCFLAQASKDKVADVKKFKHEMGIPDEKIIIGTFGFISPYKGIDTAIRALTSLDEKYVLCIFGGQHPSSIEKEPTGSNYTNKLIKLASKLNVQKNIFFCGTIKNEEKFSNYLEICDHIVLPYHEIHQSGSGVASLAIALNEKVYLSRTISFIELSTYFKNSFYFFDIGNHMELALKITTSDRIQNSGREESLKRYNIKTNIEIYKKSLSI